MTKTRAFIAVLAGLAGCGDNHTINQPPEAATSLSWTVAEDGSITIDASATDPEGDPVSYAVTAPEHGTLSGSGPSFSYAPAANYAGKDRFTITVSDGTSSVEVPVSITVIEVDDAPVASDLQATTNENQGVAVALAASDLDGPTLSYEIVDAPAHGTLSGVAPNLAYTPSTHYFGADSFTYRASDGTLASNLATVTITVADQITCGDGVLEGGEQCDDGNADNTDACLTNCMAAACGDGFVRAGTEACDDGNADNSDACLSTCAAASCGDGFVQAGTEACDDGNADNTDACLQSCVAASCGDGVVQAGVEACDDANANNTDACLSTCVAASCGDGIVQAGSEACDDGNADNTDACLSTCVAATCGDGFVRTGSEACDDANQSNTDACLTTCQAAACGDGFVQAGSEACDDANQSNTDACLTTCQAAACGDGFVQAGSEACDDGNANNTDACLSTCVAASCGDGFVQAGSEACDDGNADNTDACLSSCVAASCGDGIVRAGVEVCDDGNAVNTDACLDTCAAASCGDGFVEAGVEQCDDGNAVDTDACPLTCESAWCGDGFLQAGVEDCDDGNLTDNDGCGHSCKVEGCGDGLVQFPLGETCDDGNLTDNDGCDATCQVEPFVTVAPVKISGALSCTTAVANAARKIAVDVSGTIYAVMKCGNAAYATASTNRGVSFSAPIELSAALPGAPVTVSQVAVASGPTGVAYVAMMLNGGQLYLRTTEDRGATWGSAVLVGTATSTSSGLSLQSFNDDVYIGFSQSGGVAVARNHNRGTGTFELTPVAMSIAYFDLLYDVRLGTLAVCADTPTFHIRTSSDAGVTFAAEVNPPGQEYYSDWAIGNGNIYVSGTNLGSSGDSNKLYIIPSNALGTSSSVTGLPVVTAAQTRSVAADAAGNAFVASQLNAGGVRLDRLPYGANAFDAPRTLSPTGGSPVAAPLPGGQGAAVVYTDGTSVWATVQAY